MPKIELEIEKCSTCPYWRRIEEFPYDRFVCEKMDESEVHCRFPTDFDFKTIYSRCTLFKTKTYEQLEDEVLFLTSQNSEVLEKCRVLKKQVADLKIEAYKHLDN